MSNQQQHKLTTANDMKQGYLKIVGLPGMVRIELWFEYDHAYSTICNTYDQFEIAMDILLDLHHITEITYVGDIDSEFGRAHLEFW